MAGKKKPDGKVDRALGKPRSNAMVEQAHRAKPGTVDGIIARAERRPVEPETPEKKKEGEGGDDQGGGCG